MRKHLIGTILVLAALAACNKEIDTQTPATVDPVEETPAGKVTLTFKATIGEETRTVYANDKTASWAAGDKISVCLTDSESYDVVDFTTEDGVTFSGEVNPGYTTPVSAIYPANEVYTTYAWNSYFSQDNGSVTAVRLADGYELGSDDDPGKFIPLIGSYDGETMTFHHFCNTLKVTLTNIPEDAAYFTFATNKQKLVSDFSLTGGRMGLVSQEDDVDTSVSFEFEPGSLTTRSFYIPVPDGTLAANSYVALQDGGGADLFKKRITSSPTFGLNANSKDAIRVLPEVACWTRNEDWTAYYYGSYKTSGGTIGKRIRAENLTGNYYYEVLTNSVFTNTYGGSVVEYLSSQHFSDLVNGLTSSYSAPNLNINFTSMNKGTRYVMLFGLDSNMKFTGEYNCIKVVYPSFTKPVGWSINVTENTNNFAVRYTVPKTTKWQYVSVSASSFADSYLSDLEYLIYSAIRSAKSSYESDPSKWEPRTGTITYTNTFSGEYVVLLVGIDDDYRPTGEYQRLDYNFEKETPTAEYERWIGTWKVVDNQASPKTNTWTISRKRANHTYNVKGVDSAGSTTCEAVFDPETGNIKIQKQEHFWYITSGNEERSISLFARKGTTFYSSVVDIMFAQFNDDTYSTATLNGFEDYDSYYLPFYVNGVRNTSTSYGIRYLPSTMTKQ